MVIIKELIEYKTCPICIRVEITQNRVKKLKKIAEFLNSEVSKHVNQTMHRFRKSTKHPKKRHRVRTSGFNDELQALKQRIKLKMKYPPIYLVCNVV